MLSQGTWFKRVLMGGILAFTACQAPPARNAGVAAPAATFELAQAPITGGGGGMTVQLAPLLKGNPNPLRKDSFKGSRIGREEQYRDMRRYPGDSIPALVRQKGYDLLVQQTAALQARRASSPETAAPAAAWQSVGPAPIVDGQLNNVKHTASGRVTAVLVHPQNPNIVYVGAAQGGVWKTTNGGDSFVPLTDFQPSLSIGTMAFDPNNPEVIYVGTGEPHGSDSYYGAGILKSSNGGGSWVQLGASTFAGMGIADIVISKNDPNTIYVATATDSGKFYTKPVTEKPGIYKSTDGGQTWALKAELCYPNGFCAGVSALVASANDPNTLFAGVDTLGVTKSTDSGNTWTTVLTFQNENMNRIEVNMSKANPNVLYAGIEFVGQQSTVGYIYRSTNGGNTWDELTGAPNSGKPLNYSYCGEQCSYDNVIVLHPTNQNIVFAGGNGLYSTGITGIDGVLFRSTNGGAAWSFNPGNASNTTLHPDLHAIAFAPSNPNIVWLGTDGGVYRSTDGGNTWQPRNNGLATLQFQGVALHPTNATTVFGGMQDNAKAKTTNAANWVGVDVGDGGFAAIDPFDPKYFYGTRFSISGSIIQFQRNDQSGSSAVSGWVRKSTGINVNDRVLFYAPFALDPNTAGKLFFGTNKLYRSTNRGDSWSVISPDLTNNTRGAISAISVAKGNGNVLLVGTSVGTVQASTNGGTNWVNLTKAPLPNRFVADVHAKDAQTFYVAFNGFNDNTPGSPGHVFKTSDSGQTWENISRDGAADGLPDLPIQAMVVDGANIYVGTDTGVYRSTNDGTSWEPFNEGLPTVAVFDLALQSYGNVKILAAATHGRSIWHTTILGNPAALVNKVYLPSVLRNYTGGQPLPTPTATIPGESTPTPTPTGPANNTPTPTPTPTATTSGQNTPTPTATAAGQNTPTPTPTATSPSGGTGINGTVRNNNAAIANIEVRLYNCNTDDTNCIIARSTTTNASGQYNFSDATTLATGRKYFVAYENGEGANADDSDFLFYWRSSDIASYTAGSTVDGGSFDIVDVKLSSPPNGATRPVPTTFQWLGRGIAGDTYSWGLEFFGSEVCVDKPPVAATSFELDQAGMTACSLFTNLSYAWYVYVTQSGFSNGYGVSYNAHGITLSDTANTVAQNAPQRRLVPPTLLHNK